MLTGLSRIKVIKKRSANAIKDLYIWARNFKCLVLQPFPHIGMTRCKFSQEIGIAQIWPFLMQIFSIIFNHESHILTSVPASQVVCSHFFWKGHRKSLPGNSPQKGHVLTSCKPPLVILHSISSLSGPSSLWPSHWPLTCLCVPFSCMTSAHLQLWYDSLTIVKCKSAGWQAAVVMLAALYRCGLG